MVTHNWWHQALFALDLDRRRRGAGASTTTHVWGEVQGLQPGPGQRGVAAGARGTRRRRRRRSLAGPGRPPGAPRQHDHVLPFLDLQYLYGLARAGRTGSGAGAGWPASSSTRGACRRAATPRVWQRVCVPAAPRPAGARAPATGQTAVEALGQALPRLLEIGGSHAQRDLFAQVHLDALVRERPARRRAEPAAAAGAGAARIEAPEAPGAAALRRARLARGRGNFFWS